MRFSLKKALAGVAMYAALAAASPFIGGAAPAAAATNNGAATINPTSGNSGTNFTLGLGVNPTCPGDSASGNFRIQSFMIPAAADVDSTLTFGSSGPTAVSGEFRQPLFDTNSSPYVNKLTDQAVPPATTGGISGLPQFNWGVVFAPGDVPAGHYRIGIACTLGPAGPTQLQTYWSRVITVTGGGGGPSQFNWAVAVAPDAPVLASPLGVGDGSLTATFSQPGTPAPPVSGYTATATPTGGGTAVTATGATSPITIPGLTNGTSYDVTVHGTNAVGDSAESNVVSGTPVEPTTYKVDAEIRRANQTAFVGDNVYNTTGANQSRTTSVHRGGTGQFVIRFRNEANVVDDLKVKGPGNTPGFTVKYFNGATNVTAQVVAGTFHFNNVPVNGTRNLTVKVTVGAHATIGANRNVLVKGTSLGDTTKKDAVMATVHVLQ